MGSTHTDSAEQRQRLLDEVNTEMRAGRQIRDLSKYRLEHVRNIDKLDLSEERLRSIKQLGVDDVVINAYTPLLAKPWVDGSELVTDEYRQWSADGLKDVRAQVESAGLRLFAVGMNSAFFDKVILGKDGAEAQLEYVKDNIRAAGQAGIPVVEYTWAPAGVWRTTETKEVRGGAEATAFDYTDAEDTLFYDREYTEEEFWENYEYFLEEVLPVAEEAGVTLAVHPNDPPIDKLGGIPFLLSDFESIKRALNLVPSENHGHVLCLGCWSEMGEDLDDAIRYFGENDKIVYIHFRQVVGTMPEFYETFVDDPDGYFDEYEIMELLDKVGFNGIMTTDHVPFVDEEERRPVGGPRGRAYTVGYLNGLLKAVKRED